MNAGSLIESLLNPGPRSGPWLRKVGIVTVTQAGQQRLYQLEASALKPVYEWAKSFEQHWDHQLDRIQKRAEKRAKQQRS